MQLSFKKVFISPKAIPNVFDLISSFNLQGKLKHREYATVTQLESDLKRLIYNAKTYNSKTSDIFSNAEKLRKMLATQMNRINPAYHDGSGYTPFPTPIPEKKDNATPKKENGTISDNDKETAEASVDNVEEADGETAGAKSNIIFEKIDDKAVGASGSKADENDIDADGETDPEESAEKPQPSVTSVANDSITRRASSTPADQDNVDTERGFEGLSFQEAQEKIVGELIQRKDDEYAKLLGT